jgi:phosphate-selective porin
MRRITCLFVHALLGLSVLATTATGQATPPAGATVLNDMGPAHGFKVNEAADPKTKEKVPVGSIEQVEGKVGPA